MFRRKCQDVRDVSACARRAEAMASRPAVPARIKSPLESPTHRTKRQIRRKLKNGVKEAGLQTHRAWRTSAKDTFFLFISALLPLLLLSPLLLPLQWAGLTQQNKASYYGITDTSLRSPLPPSFPSLILSSSGPRINNETLGSDGESAPSCWTSPLLLLPLCFQFTPFVPLNTFTSGTIMVSLHPC